MATTTAARKRTATTPDTDADTEVEVAENTNGESTSAPVAKAKRVRSTPTAVLEVVEELPEDVTAPRGEGFGQSKWVKLLAEVAEAAPVGVWAKRMQYEKPGGAREAAKGLAAKPEVFPEVDNSGEPGDVYWLVDDRKVQNADGSRGSALFVGRFSQSQHSEAFQMVAEKAAKRAEQDRKRKQSMAENGTTAGRPKSQ